MNAAAGDFASVGFLAADLAAEVGSIRAESAEGFQLAEDVNAALMQIIASAINRTTAGTNWSKEAVATRLLMRTSSSLQGVIMLSERGMIAPSRMLVRTIVEDSFTAAALTKNPDIIIRMLQDDAEASRKRQAKFITGEGLGYRPEDLAKLEAAIDEMDHKAKLMNQRAIAKLGGMLPQYLNYLRLSEDSVHTSVTSLHKHVYVNPNGSGWYYKLGPGKPDENNATLHRAVLAALPVAIVVCQVVPESASEVDLEVLGHRLQALPQGSTI